MTDTPLQSIQKFQTDANILDDFLNEDANSRVDFSQAQDGSDMRPSLQMLAANLGFHPAQNGPVAAMQTGGLPANTYNNGASGVGATLTANANGAFNAANIDNVAPVVGMRVLLYGVGGGSLRAGIYTFTQVGDGGTPWILTRATDADSAAELGYLLAWVAGGDTLAGTLQLIPFSGANIVVGTTQLTVQQIPAPDAFAVQNGQSSCSVPQTADFTLDGSAYLWLVDDTAGNVTAHVPAGASFPNQGWAVKKIKNTANHVTINMNNAAPDMLDDAASFQLNNKGACLAFQNRRGGANWYITSLYLT